MKHCVCIIITVLLVGFGCLGAHAQSNKTAKIDNKDRSQIRYVIANNEVDRKLDSKDEDRRVIDVLIDQKGFSKEGLTGVLKLISKRFPNPIPLYVDVYTALEDVSTPEERDKSVLSENPIDNPRKGDYAVFVRTKKKAFFYMYFANGEFQEVELNAGTQN